MMEIICVKHDLRDGKFRAVQEVSDGLGGTILNLFIFPEDTLEWRSAEYQIEPDQTDLLMDIVLYEGMLPGPPGPPILFTAATIEEARETHVARVLALKAEVRPVARSWKSQPERVNRLRKAGVDQEWLDLVTTDDALDPIRAGHLMSPEVIVEKALLVRDTRRRAAEDREIKSRRRGSADRAQAIRAARVRGETPK